MSFDKKKSMGFAANHLARLFAHRLQDEIAPLGLAPAQFMTLLELWEADGLTQADLTARLDVEQATMANTLKRMERDGLVTKAPHPQDRRAQLVFLTGKARKLEKPAKEAAQSVNKKAVSGLSKAQASEALKLVCAMIDNLRDDGKAE